MTDSECLLKWFIENVCTEINVIHVPDKLSEADSEYEPDDNAVGYDNPHKLWYMFPEDTSTHFQEAPSNATEVCWDSFTGLIVWYRNERNEIIVTHNKPE